MAAPVCRPDEIAQYDAVNDRYLTRYGPVSAEGVLLVFTLIDPRRQSENQVICSIDERTFVKDDDRLMKAYAAPALTSLRLDHTLKRSHRA